VRWSGRRLGLGPLGAINDLDNNIVTIPDGIPGVACGMVIS
jgi:hypothetical protein